MRQRRRIAAYGLSRDDQGRVLLVRGSPRDDSPGAWYLPGGGVEHGEAPLAAVIREYREETGLAIAVTRLRDVLTDVIPRPARGIAVHTDRVIYDVKITGGTLANEVDGSSDLAEWIAPDRLASLPLVPYVARILGLPPPQIEPVPGSLPAEPVTGPVQRFAAYGLVTDPAGRILLTRIADGYPGAGTWHLPGGGTDFGEQPAEGLLRELAEETAQRGRVTELIGVGHFHNPTALGPEGYRMDWHTVRAVYRVTVDEPTEARVTEAAGGSTADARWYAPDQAKDLRLNEFARSVLRDLLG